VLLDVEFTDEVRHFCWIGIAIRASIDGRLDKHLDAVGDGGVDEVFAMSFFGCSVWWKAYW